MIEYLFKLFQVFSNFIIIRFVTIQIFFFFIQIKYAQKRIKHVGIHKAISLLRQEICSRRLWKIHPQSFSILSNTISSFEYFSLLHYTICIFTDYIHTLRKRSRGTRGMAQPEKSYTTNFERDSFDSTTIIRTNVTRVPRPFTSSPRSLWKSHPHERELTHTRRENRRLNSSAWMLFTFHFPSRR